MRLSVWSLISATVLVFVPSFLIGQSNNAQLPRITEEVTDANLALLANHVHPLVRKSVDHGAVDGGLPMDRLTLVLKRSDAQQQALTKLLEEQQDRSSPNYHHWLTPTEFGERFGPAQPDVEKVVGWLQSSGFTVDKVANGRGFMEFSGNAAQVAKAFHTSIHQYQLVRETHIANATDPSIPAALAPVVAAVHSLNDFRKKPLHYDQAPKVAQIGTDAAKPSLTFNDGSHALAPADYATIYDIRQTYQQGINGVGRTIAVVGRSNVSTTLLNNFRSLLLMGIGLNGSYTTILNGPDPGRLGGGEEAEAYLDNEWASAVAPGAAIKFVVSKSTSTSDGVDLSEQYIIDTPSLANHVDVMTESFGTCEADDLSAGTLVSSLAQQAAAEGITYTVSSGDSGAALCANPSSASATGTAANPSVNILASSPYTVAVGGTEFNEGKCTLGLDSSGHEVLICDDEAAYWSATNSNFQSVLGYIPEAVWNEACPATTTGSITGCGAANANLYAAGGGASVLFNKPSWQKLAIPGIPADDHRYLPDVSLTAAGHDPYLICANDTITKTHPRADCDPDSTGLVYLSAIAGTSASAPSFAGAVALLDQKLGGSQGDIHNGLYSLAAQENFSTCNSSTGAHSSGCVFSDITVGNNAVPGMANYGSASALYQAGAGFDQASGLGSLDITNFINSFASASGTAANSITLIVEPSTSTQGDSVTLTAAVTGSGGTPTGNVKFINSNFVALGTATLASGTATLTSTTLPAGTYTVSAIYSGDSQFAASESSAVNVVVKIPVHATTTTLTVTPATSNFGDLVQFDATVSSDPGLTPTGIVRYVTSDNVVLSYQNIGPNGHATAALLPQVGTYTVTAQYGGDSNSGEAKFSGSNSAPVSVTVNSSFHATKTALTATPAVSNQGTSVTLTATITSTSAGVPSGSVSFQTVGGTALGIVNLTGGVATLATTNLDIGTYDIVALYDGDSTFAASSSPNVTVTVNPVVRTATTTTLNVTPAASILGASVTMTATVSATGGGVPTGNITLSGPGVGTLANIAVDSTGVAKFTTTTLPQGNYAVTADYSGDSTFASSISAAVNLTVSPVAAGAFTLSANSTTVNLASEGSSGTSVVTVTPTNGFTGTVNLTCAIAAQSGKLAPTCGVAPTGVTLGAATNATVRFGSIAPTGKPVNLSRSAGWMGAGGAVFAGVFMFGVAGRRRRVWGLMLALLMMIAVLSGVGCGGNASATHSPGTSAGTYTAMITGTSGTLTTSTQIMVVVP